MFETMVQQRMTIEDLAGMTQRGFTDVENRLTERIETGFKGINERFQGINERFKGMDEKLGLVLEMVKSIDEGMIETRTLRRVDVPAMESRVGMLENDVKKIKVKLNIRN